MTSIFMTHYLLRHIYQGVNLSINHFYRSFQLYQIQMNLSGWVGIHRVDTKKVTVQTLDVDLVGVG